MQQNTTILVRVPDAGGNWAWASYKDGAASFAEGDIARLTEDCQDAKAVVFLAAGEDVTLKAVEFAAAERKHLAQTVRYSLEEDVSEDIEDLHFALGAATGEGNRVAVAMVSRARLEHWLAPFAENDIEVQAVVPEQSLLPLKSDSWTLLVDQQRCLVRANAGEGFVLEWANVGFALQLLLDELGEVPKALHIYGVEDRQDEFRTQLPELVRDVAEWHTDDYWKVMVAGWPTQASAAPNLLQGDYVRSLPWLKWWGYWRIAAGVALVAVLLQLVLGVSTIQSLERENLALRTEVEQTYRQVVPKGKIVDPAKQLKRKVDAMKGSSGDGFMRMYAKIAEAVTAAQGVTLQAMTYSENQSEIRMTLLAPSFNDIETLRAGIEKRNLKAELTGSSNEAGGTRARLRIQG